ncbi:MAG: MCE family protein [Phyllobacteriaceae bacterium]|nr:MCE family protein [Phyllobacteriaceae bacterium]
MNRNIIETIMGAVVLLVAVLFLAFAYSSSSTGGVDGYEVTAKFGRVDGLVSGSDVRLSGIKVGSIVDQRLKLSLPRFECLTSVALCGLQLRVHRFRGSR